MRKNKKYRRDRTLASIILAAVLFLFADDSLAVRNPIFFNDYQPIFLSPIQIQSQEDTIPPHISITSWEADGAVTGYVEDMPRNADIRSNMASIETKILDNYLFKKNPSNIDIGKDSIVYWELTVRDKFLDAAAEIIFSDFAGNDTTLIVDYTAPKSKISPKRIEFKDIITGQKPYTEFIIVNESETKEFVLEDLKFKRNDQGFKFIYKNEEGYLKREPKSKFINPLDTLRIVVQFEAEKEGFFSDSIGLGNKFIFDYKSYVSANVLSPIIVAQDMNFYDVTIGDTVKRTVSVHNRSKVDLYLYGYNSTKFPFWTDLPMISDENSRRILPGGQLTYNIYFAPDTLKHYKDSVVFFSNASGVDHKAYINGIGVKPGLIASSWDWGRKRIDRPDREDLLPVNPYTNKFAVQLHNSSEDTIIIYEANIERIQKPEAFEFDSTSFNNLIIPPQKSRRVEIGFHPTEVGEHEIIINYRNSIGSETKSVLKGTGIVPKISTKDVDFDTSLVGDLYTPTIRKIVFKNKNWEYKDLLDFKGLQILPEGDEISIDLSGESKTWGTEGFKIFWSNIDSMAALPKVVYPGDSLMFETKFVAQREGPAYAELKSVSDALEDYKARLTGWGIYSGLNFYLDSAWACVGAEDTLNCVIKAYGKKIIPVDSIRIEKPEFELLNKEEREGFDVLVGQERKIKILYRPYQEGLSEAELKIFYRVENSPKTKTMKLAGESFFATRNFSVVLNNDDGILDLGQETQGAVIIKEGEEISDYNINELRVLLNYNPNVLLFREDGLSLGNLTRHKFHRPFNIQTDNENGITSFTLKGVGSERLSGSGELFRFAFKSLPPQKSDSGYFSKISISITPVSNKCVEFYRENEPIVSIDRNLSDKLQWINFPSSKDELYSPYPNPANLSSSAYVEFEIKKERFVTIFLQNSTGKIIKTLLSEKLMSGKYKVKLPVREFPAGAYWVTINADNFTKTQNLVFIR